MKAEPQKPVWAYTQEVSNDVPHLKISRASYPCMLLSTSTFGSRLSLKL